jgi:hypothetical protein
VITTGIKGDIVIPFGCLLNEVWLLADATGSIQVDMWKNTYANYPPTIADTITARSITTNTKAQFTGLSTAIAAGSIIRFNVVSCTSITRVTVSLKLLKT